MRLSPGNNASTREDPDNPSSSRSATPESQTSRITTISGRPMLRGIGLVYRTSSDSEPALFTHLARFARMQPLPRLAIFLRRRLVRPLWNPGVISQHHYREREHPVHMGEIAAIDLAPFVADLVIVRKHVRHRHSIRRHPHFGEGEIVTGDEEPRAARLAVIHANSGLFARLPKRIRDRRKSESGQGCRSLLLAIARVGSPELFQVQVRNGLRQRPRGMFRVIARPQQTFFF